MAKFRVWARDKLAKVRAWFRNQWNSVAQSFTRLWSFLLARWQWGAVSVAVLGGVLIYGGILPLPTISHIAQMLGYAATVVETAEENGVMVTVRTTFTSSPEGRFLREAIIALAALVALFIAGLRSYAFFRQTETAESRLLNERFALAADLMTKETAGRKPKPAIAARINGIHIMEALAMQNPKEFSEKVVINLISYAKDHAQKTAKPSLRDDKTRLLGEDVKSAFTALHTILNNKETPAMSDDILDFSHQNFSRLILDESQVNLSVYKKWAKVNFQGSDLRCATFHKESNLWGANFIQANLRGAILSGARLDDAVMTEVCLVNAEMREASLGGADLRWADLSGACLQNANLTAARMQGSDLSLAVFCGEGEEADISLMWAHLEGARIDKSVNLRGVRAAFTHFGGAILHADLRGATLSQASFDGTDMCKAQLDGDLSEEIKSRMDGKIWHDNVAWAKGIKERPQGEKWNLAKYDDGYALAGVVRNFAEVSTHLSRWMGDVGEDAKNIRLEALKLWSDGNLPPDTPDKWCEWISKVTPEGGHPDDKYRTSAFYRNL